MADEARAREIQRSIAQVLMSDWDPIRVRDIPEAAGEYDGYVGGVYRLLASGATADRVAAHLAGIERDEMGFEQAHAAPLLSVAHKLCALDVRLHGSRPAI